MDLILVPSERELDHLLPKRRSLEPAGWIPVFGAKELRWAVCGIGPAAAAITASQLLAHCRPQRLILTGIAGAFPQSGLKPGDLVQVESECFADLGYREKNRFVTLDEMGLTMLPTTNTALGCRFPLGRLCDELPAYSAITVSAITNSHERAEALYGTFGAALENMEGAAVALACHLAETPFFQFRAVSNRIGPRDPGSWQVVAPLQDMAVRLPAILAASRP